MHVYTPHTVTVYTVGLEDLMTGEFETDITVLRGVFLDAVKAVNVQRSGLTAADAVSLYIPFSVEAVDGITLMPKKFCPPKEYRALADRSGVWTLDTEDCFFVKGEAVEPGKDFQWINGRYDYVYNVTKVDEKDFGTPDMQHWEVGGA